MSLTPSLEAAASGRLPSWAVVGEERRAHIERVAALMDEWAVQLGLPAAERRRWRAAAWLHDALRDAPPETLRDTVPEELRDVPPLLLHGPAAAARLRAEGVEDEGLLAAVGYHTLGSVHFDDAGRALYLADFLEPGRDFEPDWRAALRARMPEARDDVLREVVFARIRHVMNTARELRPETVEFWNSLAERQ
jgi:HD superfamily phosphohydrolase YqeK